MDQVTKVRKYLKREQWLALISDCQSSGMTVTAWCKQNDICEQTYYATLRNCGRMPAVHFLFRHSPARLLFLNNYSFSSLYQTEMLPS